MFLHALPNIIRLPTSVWKTPFYHQLYLKSHGKPLTGFQLCEAGDMVSFTPFFFYFSPSFSLTIWSQFIW